MNLYIGIDLGTSAAKLLLMDVQGQILNVVSREYPLEFPQPGWSQQDPDDWRKAVLEGIPELLKALQDKGITIAVVTNKPEFDAVPMVKRFFGDTFPLVVGKRPDTEAKPAPDSVLIAMKELGAEADSTLYIGDTEVDFQTAQNAGIPCVLVEWGFRSRAELDALGPFAVIAKPEELLHIIDN